MSRESNARVIELRNQLKEENDPERQKQIHSEAKELQKGEDKRIRILVNYISQLPETSARIAKTPNNTFIISLPKSLENVRNPDGAINFEKMKQLRELMAHEL